MGLDMYGFATEEKPCSPVDFTVSEMTEIHYWRKHPNLHGWMRQLYRAKGGTEESFNCTNVQLTADDLWQLEADIKADRLPHTEGFFFGESDGTEMTDDLKFVAKARDALAQNRTVYYSSWW
ncbi:MAG: phosphoglycerate kinase [Mesorhizobium sp.]|uniref:phosphoglycerate kinase n=1 Tax=Mesorhizobium sp. M2A.F.Ca.ET.067.02.1.1 TaxID=2496749 RepID=UPI000FD4D022|nr:phosphoglycerate kinase [Mesorhizobium sp. M2A.F.Ca.ET.067.02.1.1]RUW81296.1 phosphoglycerate kinase [Mesorhizobium sp. M2A.F.Ca.ET.067.02.1.1]TIU59171.1 MAG: phosphoglycerate kinase [Mesorhizobium sp.]TIW88758.1 MAG: phosphoglycerate kinase [Mesorhizobium sp.]